MLGAGEREGGLLGGHTLCGSQERWMVDGGGGGEEGGVVEEQSMGRLLNIQD